MDANVCEAKSLPKSAMVLSMDKHAGLAEDAVRSTLGGRPVRLLAFGEVVFLIMSNNQCRLMCLSPFRNSKWMPERKIVLTVLKYQMVVVLKKATE